MQNASLRFNITEDTSEPAMARSIESMFLAAAILSTYMTPDAREVIDAPVVVLPARLFDWASARLCSFDGSPPVTVLENLLRRFPAVKCERCKPSLSLMV